ncbi:hypothetical protein M569_12239, partial [Genlisea aurea]
NFRLIFSQSDAWDGVLMCLGMIGSFGDGISLPIMLLITSKIMNSFGNSRGFRAEDFARSIDKSALALCYVACVQWVACFLEGYCWTRTAERQASKLRREYLKATMRQDIGYFDLHVASNGEVIENVSHDSLVIQEAIGEKFPIFATNLSAFVGSYGAAFVLLWRLAVAGVPFVVFLIVPGLIYGRAATNIARKLSEERDAASAIVERAISSIRTVYSFAGEGETAALYRGALEGTVRLGRRQGLAKGLAVGSNGIVFAIWAFVSYYGSRLVMDREAQGGTVFAVGATIVIGGLSIGSAISNLKNLSEASVAAERMIEMITRVPKIDPYNLNGHIPESSTAGEIEFRNIRFAYPSRPETLVFKDFSLRIPSGRTVALVGRSGSGKSTAIALLQRFYDPSGGEILLDGVGINKLQIKWLRAQMGLVSQEPTLFGISIVENIRFGKEDASMEEVIMAAKASNAHDFIAQLPSGYHTKVGEKGFQLSGGQKQKIAIARAIIKSPKILLLDEPTSALDSKSETLIIQSVLDAAMAGRTNVIISHRRSTVRHSDLVAVLRDGRITAFGPCSEDDEDEEQQNLDDLKRETSEESSSRFRVDSPEEFTVSKSSMISSEADAAIPSLRRLLSMNSPEWKEAAMGCCGGVFFGAVQTFFSFVMGSMIGVYFLADHREMKERTGLYGLCFVALALVSPIVNVCQHYSFAAMGENLTRRIRERMVSKIFTFEIGWFDEEENSTGAICYRLTKDAEVVRSLVGDRMCLVIQVFSTMAFAFSTGLIIAWKLASVMIASQPLIVASFYCKHALLRNASKRAIRAHEQSGRLADEAASNLRTVAAFSSQDRILEKLDESQSVPRRESVRRSWFGGIALGASQSLMTLSWALDFWYGGRLVARGQVTPEALFRTFMILVSSGRVVADACTMADDVARADEAVSSVFSILDRVSKIEPEEDGGNGGGGVRGDVEFCDVHFAYPTRPEVMVLRGFSIRVSAGESVAIVGKNGSGKSTLIALIQRFYDPISGTI